VPAPAAATRVAGAIALIGCLACAAYGQTVLVGPGGGPPTLVGSDLAVLELQEPRKDLPCTVTPQKPVLGFDLRFHAGYDISIPLKELAGSENLLTVLFRVIYQNRKDEPVYFIQKIRVPPIEENAAGDAYLQGSFDLGEGQYRVEWLMRDRTERVCSFFWDTEAVLAEKDKTLALDIQPGQIATTIQEQFLDEPPLERTPSDSPLAIKVLVNFAPQNSAAAALQPSDTSALVALLRCIQRDPRIARFSLVAFNMQEQRVLYRQETMDRIDFPAIGDSLKELQLGRVDFSRLGRKNSESEFLASLIKSELRSDDQPDAVIFAGPKVMLQSNVPAEALKEIADPGYPVFYMNYNLNPQVNPWRDAISSAIRFFKGQEYTISRPRDLWYAVTEMVGKIVKFKAGKRTSSAAVQ
jgi:hypothetical protein